MTPNRIMQMAVGALILIFGLVLFLVTSGWLAFTMLDLAGIALILSGILFIVPGLAWRKVLPWITSLFIPGALSFAIGLILMYTGRAGWSELGYLWVGFFVALGIAFLAMYYFGPHVRWLWLIGMWIGGIGLFFLGLLLSLFGSVSAARVAGSILLIVLGLAFTFGALLRRTPGASLAHPRE